LLAGGLTLLGALPVYGQVPPPPADELPLAVAVKWAQAAIAACKAKDSSVTAIYMNADGDMKLLMRSDGIAPFTVEVGRRKAYTAIKTGMSSEDFAASQGYPPGHMLPPPKLGQPFGLPPGPNPDPNLIVAEGGLLVKKGGKIIGAVSVAGAVGGGVNDVICAEAGLAKIADKLK
jgi:uncharacterized protein GlcG (DUF336 family)